MKDFQKILEQIAEENETTPDAVQREMQSAIDAAYENPSEETKFIHSLLCNGNRPTPEQLVFHIATILQHCNDPT